jgi:hypothetical protein
MRKRFGITAVSKETHCITTDGGDDRLANLAQFRPVLEEAVLEHIRIWP